MACFYVSMNYAIHRIQPLDVHLISFPAQYFLHEFHVRIRSATRKTLQRRIIRDSPLVDRLLIRCILTI